MTPVVAHVAGVPLEETLMYLAPVLLSGGAAAWLSGGRQAVDRWRRAGRGRRARR